MTTIVLEKQPVRQSLARTFGALMSRELLVMRRTFVMTAVRVVVQPLLLVFIFAYVIPSIDAGSAFGGEAGFATVLLPGLVGSAMIMQAMAAAVIPLVMELAGPRSIEDRALAPLPVQLIGVQKIASAAVQGLIAGLLVFPVALFVHAEGQAPAVEVQNWLLLALVLVAGSLLSGSIGLLIGTLIDPRQIQVLFSVVMLPVMMLGCVYFTWDQLSELRWLQIAVLLNPLVYLSEGLRATLTPQVGHMNTWAYLAVLLAGTALIAWLAVRGFTRVVRR